MRTLSSLFVFAFVVSAAALADPVLLLSRRAGFIEALDPETLATIARIRVPGSAERITPDTSGRRIYLSTTSPSLNSCCATYSLDLDSLQLTYLNQPSMSATAIPAANRLVMQRGNVGVELFDLTTLQRIPTIPAPGVYRFSPSPDGRLLFGLTNFPRPSLDLFDVAAGSLEASHSLDGRNAAAGAWLGRQFYLLAVDASGATITAVDSQDMPGTPVALDGFARDCEYEMLPLTGRFAVYAAFGGKGDSGCTDPGGFRWVSPATGGHPAPLLPGARFRQLTASADGRYLYGLDVGEPAWRNVSVMKIDTATGQLVQKRVLENDVWFLASGVIPHALSGRTDLAATPDIR